jgi:hypothetical protein
MQPTLNQTPHFSGRTIFCPKNFRTKKFHIRKKSDLKIFTPKKIRHKKFSARKYSGLIMKKSDLKSISLRRGLFHRHRIFLPEKIVSAKKFRALKFSRAKISGQKNFTSEKNRTLKFLHPKKTGFENSERENFPARKFSVRKKVRHVLQKIALQQQAGSTLAD